MKSNTFKWKLVLFISAVLGLVITFASINVHEFGLTILTKIKEMKGDAVNHETLRKFDSSEVSHERWNELVKKHVTENGLVDYDQFKEEELELDSYLYILSKNPPSVKWSEADQIAYWINAYNAFTVKLILNHYPLESIKDISSGLPMINSPWDIKFFKIGGIDFDLNTIEHQILRKEFDEPRIHFAINCASFSCPKLRNEAFVGEKLESQLDEQTVNFLGNSDKNQITEHESKLSSIMKWFESDFTKKQTLKAFISEYNPNFDPKHPIEFMEYDWSLNN